MKLTTILKVSKTLTSLVAASATGIVVKNAIQATTPSDLGKYPALMVKAGGFFVSGAVGAFVAKDVEKQFDNLIEVVQAVTEPDIYAKGAVTKFDTFFETLTAAEQEVLREKFAVIGAANQTEKGQG